MNIAKNLLIFVLIFAVIAWVFGFINFDQSTYEDMSFQEQAQSIGEQFNNAIQKGMDYVNTHSAEEIAKVIQPQFEETSLETITTIIERYQSQDTWKTDTIFTEESFQLLQDILMDSGELEEYVPYEELVTTEYSEKAAK